jgi:hypothetical protein
MSDAVTARKVERPLEPSERIAEALFGLIMVLTFTCSISAAQPEREDVRTMLYGALGCNLVWGIIDAVLYLMGSLAERGRGIDTLRSVRQANAPEEAQRILAERLPPAIASALGPEDLERLRQKLKALPEPPPRPRLGKTEWLGALGVFLWVFLITFPLTAPFVFIQHDSRLALRISNLIAVLLLLVMGYQYGRYAGLRPWLTGLVMVVLGSALVAATIALGG